MMTAGFVDPKEMLDLVLVKLDRLRRRNEAGYWMLTEVWESVLPHTGDKDILASRKFRSWVLERAADDVGVRELYDFLADVDRAVGRRGARTRRADGDRVEGLVSAAVEALDRAVEMLDDAVSEIERSDDLPNKAAAADEHGAVADEMGCLVDDLKRLPGVWDYEPEG